MLSVGEEIMTLAFFAILYQSETNGRTDTDRRTDGRTSALWLYTSACIARYATALVKTSTDLVLRLERSPYILMVDHEATETLLAGVALSS